MTCNIEALRIRKMDIGGQIIRRLKGTTKGGANGESEEEKIEEEEGWRDEERERKEKEMEWTKWKGKKIKNIYTDGSYKENKTMKTMMLGGHKVKAGGGMVVQDEEGYYHPLRVIMDVEVESAFPVETITLLAACIIGEGEGKIEIGTDCLGAMAATRRRNKGFNRIIPIDWSKDRDINIKKVKAHPERREGVWEEDDIGIWQADLVAGGDGGIMREVLATSVLNYYGSLGSIAIVIIIMSRT